MNALALVLLIFNIIASVAIFIFQLNRNRRLAFICLFTSLFTPVFGPVMCLVMLVWVKEGHHEMAVEETIRKYTIKEAEYIDEERLLNVVPANDALALSGESERRSFLLGLLRQKDIEKLGSTLKKALYNDDPEASHYAASAIMEMQRNAYSIMAEREKIYNESSDPTYEEAISYAVSIMEYLNTSEVGQLENYAFRARYEAVLKDIFEKHDESCRPVDYENFIDMLVKQGRYAEASAYAVKYRERFPDVENSFTYRLKTAYLQHDKTALQQTIADIHNSNVLLSPSLLSKMRFWNTRQVNNTKHESIKNES